jgi:hypothetical protein
MGIVYSIRRGVWIQERFSDGNPLVLNVNTAPMFWTITFTPAPNQGDQGTASQTKTG